MVPGFWGVDLGYCVGINDVGDYRCFGWCLCFSVLGFWEVLLVGFIVFACGLCLYAVYDVVVLGVGAYVGLCCDNSWV